jgi:hypothetical protein
MNDNCERFHKTMLDEFYRVAFRKKICCSIAELQDDLNAWIESYNEMRSGVESRFPGRAGNAAKPLRGQCRHPLW